MSTNANLVHTLFATHTFPNDIKSKKNGRPIYDEVEVIEFRFAGDKQKTVVLPAHEIDPDATRERGEPVTYAQRYATQYAAFKDQSVQSQSGTPLEELTFLTQAKRRELKALNIFTAEALAALDGQPLRRLGMGGRELKNQAQTYLDNAAGSADVTAMAAELAAMRQQLQERDQQINALNAIAVAKADDGSDGVPAAQVDDDGDRASVEKTLEDCTDDELKAYITRETGKAPRANAARDTLMTQALELATRPDDASEDEAA